MTSWQVSWLAGRRFRPPSQETLHFPVASMAGDSPPTVAGAAAALCAQAHAPHSLLIPCGSQRRHPCGPPVTASTFGSATTDDSGAGVPIRHRLWKCTRDFARQCPDQIPAIGFEELLQLLTTAHGLIGDFRITPTGVGKSWRCGQSEFGIAVIGDLS